jgi:hypothetical protein
VAEHWLVWPVGTVTALQETVTEVIVGASVIAMVAVPVFVESCVEVAVIVAVPEAAGVNTPPEVIVPSVAAQVTVELYVPVP